MKKIIGLCFLLLSLTACHRHAVNSKSDVSNKGKLMTETGIASYYSDKLEGHSTANGEAYHAQKLTAAHKTLPFGTIVKVTNNTNGKSVQVRINDRGPYSPGRVIDLSKAAAVQIDLVKAGKANVTLQFRK